jgi:phospholipid transport system substrate-binding protein
VPRWTVSRSPTRAPSVKKDILIQSRGAQADSTKPIRADWRMRERDGRFRILDVSVEGVSMALMLRQEFDAVLRNQGGVDGLIKTLRDRLTAAVPAPRPASS